MSDIPWTLIVPLCPQHVLDEFSCGESAMDNWFRRGSLADHGKGVCRVHLAVDNAGVIHGFFALSQHEIAGADAPNKMANGRRTMPATLLGRIGLSVDSRGNGFGTHLLAEALRVAVVGADAVGSQIVVLDAKNDKLEAWYRQHDFRPFVQPPLRLGMKMSSARKLVSKAFPEQ